MARFSLPAASILALALLLSAFSSVALAQDSTIDVELGDFFIDMPTTIPAGPVTLNVTNVGTMPHTITIEGNGVSMTMPETLSPGGSTTWQIDLEPGTYTFYCPIGNHRALGMELSVTVEGAQAEPTPVPAEPTATEVAEDPTATPATIAPTPTVAAGATATALPGLPETGAGGSQSDGISSTSLLAISLAVLAVAAGGGLIYRSQRQTG